MSSTRKPLDLSYEQIRLNVIANLLRLLVDIYGSPKAKENLSKVEGEEIVINYPALHGSIVVKPHGGRLIAEVGESESAIATINFKVKEDKIDDIVEDIIKSSQRWGNLKVFFKYILTRKIGFSGSIGAMMNTFKALMIGDHEMYKKGKDKILLTMG
ncbi:MAG TPA: hypothetical protein VMV49_16320 [Candidatus Deferrimicrobium sp.]|nr:hypothetical protein [Candidatus Deferrimicrobium sp.]